MSTKIQMRRGTAAQWTAANPVLADGEIGFETDTGHFKIGYNGVAWSSLTYIYESFALNPVFTTQVSFPASTSSLAPLYIPSGVDKSTGLVNGDLWIAGDVIKYRASGATKSVAYLDSTMTGTWNGTAVAGQYGGTGVANTGKTITLGGNFTTSGSFTTTLTATANTSVTLPTSGTLMPNPMTAVGDIITGSNVVNGVATPIRLAGPSLGVNGTSFLYQAVAGGSYVAGGWALSSSTATASTIAVRDASANLFANSLNNVSLATQTTGFTVAGGSVTSKTLTVNNAYTLSGSDATISLAGNLTTAAAFTQAGAFATTLTSTASTNVTLPTTGTLVANTHASLSGATTAMAFATNSSVLITPTATGTYTTTVPAAGTRVTLIVLTSGVTSYTITFGTGFKATATLVTGTTTAKYWTVNFISDGTNVVETGRSGPI